MAKREKAAKVLTPEEKLEQALVPVNEQPYPIPENWCWIRFSNVIELISGRDAALTDCNDEGIGIPYILGASNIENNTYTVKRWIEKPQVISQKGDILLSVKGTIGKLYVQKEDEINISRQIMSIRPAKVLNRNLAYSFLQSVCDELREAGNGLIPGISRVDILNKAFPFMPLTEQQRIVDRIESLFAKLDEAKEKVHAVVDSFELRKSAILHKAFTGELTKQWRQAYGVELDSWQNKYLKDVCQYMKAGGDKPADFVVTKDTEHCIPVVANGLTKDGIVGYTAKAKYGAGTVTVSGRGTIGYSIYRNYPIYPVVRLIVLCPTTDILPKFLKYAFDAYPEEGTGSSIPQLTVPSIKEKNIPIPVQEEQTEIIRILDEIFTKEQQAKEAAESVIGQIDTMKKAVLARAFRGELGTNDPTEESAVELLKAVLSS